MSHAYLSFKASELPGVAAFLADGRPIIRWVHRPYVRIELYLNTSGDVSARVINPFTRAFSLHPPHHLGYELVSIAAKKLGDQVPSSDADGDYVNMTHLSRADQVLHGEWPTGWSMARVKGALPKNLVDRIGPILDAGEELSQEDLALIAEHVDRRYGRE